MSYQALYRKFRPDNFGEVKGQEHIVTTLTNQIKSDHIGHAYLFCGTRGTGKTTVAKVFAKAVNCENPGENGPCGECEMCRAIAAGASMNVVEMDAASNNKVDDIRQVIEEVQYSPAQGKYKVYIIDEVHMLTTSAFNALLKTLEEPPPYLIFILATTEVHKIPLTILSRCQRYDFRRISVETIAARLKELLDQEGIEAEDRALTYIAKMADGAMRDGLSLLEQCISFYFGEVLTYEKLLKVLGAVDNDVYASFTEVLAEGDVAAMMETIDGIMSEGKDLGRFCDELIWYLRNILIAKSTEHPETVIDMSQENLNRLTETAKRLETEMVFRYIRVLSEVENQMKYASQKRVLFEVALIRLCRPEMEKDYESVINRLHNIEEQMKKGVVVSDVPSEQMQGAASVPQKKELPEKKIRESAVPAEVKALAANWQQVLNYLDPVSKNMVNHVTLTVDDAGTLIIAFSEDTSYSYFAGEEHRQMLEQALAETAGKDVNMELKYMADRREYDALPELRGLFGDSDIQIEAIE
ncbi:MAG: DNA polymerase III subunit gamma/tau [Roseburia sp.]|nr:DNA polymerase III subunit gamma/tau [Roseburia sp.]